MRVIGPQPVWMRCDAGEVQGLLADRLATSQFGQKRLMRCCA
jgi:hypothetical protein